MSKNTGKGSKGTQPGTNVTGTGTAPVQAPRTAQGAQQGRDLVTPAGDFRTDLAKVHLEYVRDADTLGSMPPPTTLKGAAKSFVDLLQTRKTTTFLDKIGERLAFERTGTRLYDLLLVKHELHGSWSGGPTRADLERFRNDELDHFHLLVDAMRKMGADPTAVTPSADVAGVEAIGLQKVLADARTTLPQALHAIHVAELADRDGWDLLIELATAFGQTDLANRFRSAGLTEENHLRHVREWMRAFAMSDAGVKGGGATTP